MQSDSENDSDVAERPSTQPILGSKRKHPASGPFKEEAVASKRVKRNADGTESVSEKTKTKPKKVVKKPTEFKAGKWNPETELVTEELEKCGDNKSPVYECCIICNNRNVHRAVNIRNPKLLKELVLDRKNITYLDDEWSVNNKATPIMKIVQMNDLKMLEALYPNETKDKKNYKADGVQALGGNNAALDSRMIMSSFYGDRVKPRDFLLQTIDTGRVGKKAYGVNIRQVNVTRGNRQGNDAFKESSRQVYGFVIPKISNP